MRASRQPRDSLVVAVTTFSPRSILLRLGLQLRFQPFCSSILSFNATHTPLMTIEMATNEAWIHSARQYRPSYSYKYAPVPHSSSMIFSTPVGEAWPSNHVVSPPATDFPTDLATHRRLRAAKLAVDATRRCTDTSFPDPGHSAPTVANSSLTASVSSTDLSQPTPKSQCSRFPTLGRGNNPSDALRGTWDLDYVRCQSSLYLGESPAFTLASLLDRLSGTRCSDPRDLVYSILNVSNLAEPGITIDYCKIITEVFSTATRMMIRASGDLI